MPSPTAELAPPAPDPASPLPDLPPRAAWVGLGAALMLGLVLRVGAMGTTAFYDWDSGFYVMRMAAHLGDLWTGQADSPFGASHPTFVSLGLPILIRLTPGLSLAAAGQLWVLGASLATIGLGYALAARLGSRAAGALTALVLAVDTAQVEAASTARSGPVFTAFVTASLVVLLGGDRLTTRRAVAAALLAGVATWVRGVGLAACLGLGLLLAWRVWRGQASRRAAATGLVLCAALCAAAWTLQGMVEVRNGATPYLAHVHADTLYIMDRYPEAYFTDATELTLRIASEPPTFREAYDLDFILELTGRNLRECAWHLGLLAGLSLLAATLLPPAERVRLLLVGAFGVSTVAASVVACAPPTDMYRYVLPARVVFVALASLAPCLWAARGPARRVRLLRWLPALGLGLSLAIYPPRSLTQLGRYAQGTTWRQRSARLQDELAQVLPRHARVARGPGGEPTAVSLAGAHPVYLPNGPTPAAVQAYVRGNQVRWVVFETSQRATLERLLPDARLEEAARYPSPDGEQVLARIRLDS